MNPATTRSRKDEPYQSNLVIDTLALSESLQEVGVPANQAKRHVQMVADVFEHNMSTKADVQMLRSDMEAMRVELKKDIAELRNDIEIMRLELKKEMAETKSQILMWVAGMLLAQAGFIAALQKLLG